jgi:stage III sporulation protein AG
LAFWDEWKKLFNPGGKGGGRLKSGSLLLILLVVGTALLLFNSFFSFGGEKESPPAAPAEEAATPWTDQQMAAQLAAILSKIRGVGKVELFLTPGTSGRKELVTDMEQSRRQTSEGDSEGGTREIIEETTRSTYVLLRDAHGNEVPLVAEEEKPRYRGVLVVAEGVDDPAVKARVIEALQALLGLPAHRITVLPR